MIRNYLLPSLILLLITFCGFVFLKNSTKSSNSSASLDDMPPTVTAFQKILKTSPAVAEDTKGAVIPASQLLVDRKWTGNTCKATCQNIGKTPLQVSTVFLFSIPAHGLPPESPVYGEGFQMLHQNGGTLQQHENIGVYPDNKHYNIPDVHGLPTVYGMMVISVKKDEHMLLGFTSCKRFIGRISYNKQQMQVSVDTEGLELKPGESWSLEEFTVLRSAERGALFERFASQITVHHPTRKTPKIPTGWCSWYCYGPAVTNKIMEENLQGFKKILPELKYIQLDDGYQPFMGDWTDPNPAYGDIQETIASIRKAGFEPAIWVAPFIAEKGSRVFREHSDWFVKDVDQTPLLSSKIGFGGWRNGPWYVLDGTHPEVQKHFQNVISTMREKWGINYFKLDANYWGAIHKGIHHDPHATRIQAYRRGMEALFRGCDANSVMLACNAPIWPSLGLATAMRTSGDISREWGVIRGSAYENLCRAWQNGTLWDSDPDCVVLANDTVFTGKEPIRKQEWMFHATSIHAVGGSVLSGDKAANLKENELAILKKLLRTNGKGATFSDAKMETGFTDMGDTQYYYFFNWDDHEIKDLTVRLKSKAQLTDFWTHERLGVFENTYTVTKLTPHSARLIMASKK